MRALFTMFAEDVGLLPARSFTEISHYQSRWIDTDLDLVLCAQDLPWLDRGLTAWVCQQPDLRYRWTERSLARLAYLADCWDAYARCDFGWEARLIGANEFPLHPGHP